MARTHTQSRSYIASGTSTFGITGPPWWHQLALCRQTDPDLFHPRRGDPTDQAEAICARCPVMNTCLVAGVDNREPHGIYGGLTIYGRAKITASALALARRGAAREGYELRDSVAA